MKFVKFSVFALTMGIFATSCGGGKGDAAKTDSAAMAPAVTETVAPTPAPAMDTTKKMDSAAAATTTTTTTATETKK